jgi:hypothetical protein
MLLTAIISDPDALLVWGLANVRTADDNHLRTLIP